MLNRREFLAGVAVWVVISRPARSEPVIDVARFGAKFDGRSDDHGAISAALQEASSSRGGKVRLMRGVAAIGNTIEVPSGVEVFGFGDESVLRAKPGLNTHIIASAGGKAGASNITFRNFLVDGAENDQDVEAASRGLYLFAVRNLLITGITVRNTVGHCIHLSNAGASGWVQSQVVTNCRLIGAGRGGGIASSGLATTDSHDLRVAQVISQGHERAGFRLGVSGTATLEDTIALNCGDGGYVPVSGSQGITFRRARAYRNGAAGAFDGFRLVGIARTRLEDCVSEQNDGAGLLLLNGCEDIVVSGGQFNDNGQSPAPIEPEDSRSGISIKSTGRSTRGVEISGVTCTNRQQVKVQCIGVEIADRGATGVRIQSSDLRGNRIAALVNRSGGKENVTLRGIRGGTT